MKRLSRGYELVTTTRWLSTGAYDKKWMHAAGSNYAQQSGMSVKGGSPGSHGFPSN